MPKYSVKLFLEQRSAGFCTIWADNPSEVRALLHTDRGVAKLRGDTDWDEPDPADEALIIDYFLEVAEDDAPVKDREVHWG